MASELRVNTLKDASGNNSIAMTYVANGVSKVWVSWNGDDTSVIRDSLNCDSIFDNGTGDHRVNYTVTFANVGYSPQMNCQSGDASNPASAPMYDQNNTLTTSCRTYVTQSTNSGAGQVFDSEHMSVTCTGDLA